MNDADLLQCDRARCKWTGMRSQLVRKPPNRDGLSKCTCPKCGGNAFVVLSRATEPAKEAPDV